MKVKKGFVVIGALTLLGMASTVSAQTVTANVETGIKINATSAAAKAEVRGSATSSAAKDNAASKPGTTTDSSGEAKVYRSAVATFVKGLLSIADRDGGIGAEVRVIAKSQQDSASTSANAMLKADANKQKGFKAFLLGSNYKTIGQLRSEMTVTKNNIEKLERLAESTANAQVKADLLAQIKVLEDSQVKIQAFIDANKGVSLLGWAI
jgi:hypothetical protein